MTASQPQSPSLQADPLAWASAAAIGLAIFALVVGAPPHGAVRQREDRRHARLPELRRRDGARRGALPRLRARVSARRAARLPRSPRSDRTTSYDELFDVLMLVLGAATVVLVAVALYGVGAPPAALYGGVLLAALDAAPHRAARPQPLRPLAGCSCVVAALAALVHERMRLGLGLLGAAVAAKIYPARAAPARRRSYVWRRRGPARGAHLARRLRARSSLVIFGPFLALAPGGVVDSITRQTDRPLQIESLGASLLLAAHRTQIYDAIVVSSHGSQNLAGPLPDTLATRADRCSRRSRSPPSGCVFARSDRGRRSRCSSLRPRRSCAFIAFGKVLSPQFLIWLLPLVPFLVAAPGARCSSACSRPRSS